ncbi:hypothetical protein E1211_20780, partial [Micromonospora sp. 15K316]
MNDDDRPEGRHRGQADEPTAFLPKVDRAEPGADRPRNSWPDPVLPPRAPATPPSGPGQVAPHPAAPPDQLPQRRTNPPPAAGVAQPGHPHWSSAEADRPPTHPVAPLDAPPPWPGAARPASPADTGGGFATAAGAPTQPHLGRDVSSRPAESARPTAPDH